MYRRNHAKNNPNNLGALTCALRTAAFFERLRRYDAVCVNANAYADRSADTGTNASAYAEAHAEANVNTHAEPDAGGNTTGQSRFVCQRGK